MTVVGLPGVMVTITSMVVKVTIMAVRKGLVYMLGLMLTLGYLIVRTYLLEITHNPKRFCWL